MTQKLFPIIIAGFVLLVSCNNRQAANNDDKSLKSKQNHLTAATLWQQTSAEAYALNIQNYKLAEIMLEENLKSGKSEKPKAIITDLDETVLDNSAYNARMIKKNHPYTPETWAEWVKEEKAEAIPGALDFFKFADSLGVTIFYLSNRADSAKKHTVNNLKALGLPQIGNENILLKTETSDKTKRRKFITDEYDVILYLGDNLRDFTEDFARRDERYGKNIADKKRRLIGTKFIVFANPMYGEWEKPIMNYSYDHSDEEAFKLRFDALDIKK